MPKNSERKAVDLPIAYSSTGKPREGLYEENEHLKKDLQSKSRRRTGMRHGRRKIAFDFRKYYYFHHNMRYMIADLSLHPAVAPAIHPVRQRCTDSNHECRNFRIASAFVVQLHFLELRDSRDEYRTMYALVDSDANSPRNPLNSSK